MLSYCRLRSADCLLPTASCLLRSADCLLPTASCLLHSSLPSLTRFWHSFPMPVRREISQRDEIPPGTLYMLILKTLSRSGELHGYEIANSIQQMSGDVLQVEEGSLYPALQRMLLKGWVRAEWGVTPENRRARYYRLTTLGRKELELEVSQFQRVFEAIQQVLRPA